MAQGISRQVERAQLILEFLDEDEWLTSAEIGKLVGIGRQAVTPYIRSLKTMGHDIESFRGKGHRLRKNNSVGSLLLRQDELYALFLSLTRSRADFPTEIVTRIQRRLLALLSKQRQLEAKHLRAAPAEDRAYFQDFEILRAAQRSIEKGRLLRVEYQGIKDAHPRMRRVVPVEFVPKKDYWYLIVYDVEGQGERHFRIDRISSAVTLPEKGAIPDGFTRGTMHPWDFGSSFIQVELKVRSELARWLQEEPAHPSQKLTAIDQQLWHVSFRVSTLGKFIDWLMGLRGFELLGPECVVDAMRQRAQEILLGQGTLNTPWEIRGVATLR